MLWSVPSELTRSVEIFTLPKFLLTWRIVVLVRWFSHPLNYWLFKGYFGAE